MSSTDDRSSDKPRNPADAEDATAAGRADDAADAGVTPHEAGFAAHLRRTWRWWLLGLVCAAGLGVFMWAVDGRINKPAPEPSGVAATPAEAVEKFLAAVDRHDADLARRYAGETLDPHVADWIDRAGYVRLVDAAETTSVPAASGEDDATGSAAAADVPGAVALDVTYEAATGFLDDDDPLGLNLALLVWTEDVEHPFIVAPAADGGWVVEDGGPPLRK